MRKPKGPDLTKWKDFRIELMQEQREEKQIEEAKAITNQELLADMNEHNLFRYIMATMGNAATFEDPKTDKLVKNFRKAAYELSKHLGK